MLTSIECVASTKHEAADANNTLSATSNVDAMLIKLGVRLQPAGSGAYACKLRGWVISSGVDLRDIDGDALSDVIRLAGAVTAAADSDVPFSSAVANVTESSHGARDLFGRSAKASALIVANIDKRFPGEHFRKATR